MYLTDEDIRNAYIVKIPNATANGFDAYADGDLRHTKGPEGLKLNFTGESINPRYARLFQASPILYQVVATQLDAMLKLEKVLRDKGELPLAALIGNTCNGYRLALSAAVDGIEKANESVMAMQVLNELKPLGGIN